MVLALATTVAFLALAGWYETGRAGALVWFGVALGLALSAKHTLLVMGPVFALVVLLRFRADMRAGRSPAIGVAVASAAVALAIPAPWYVQNAVWTGNPLYPYFWGLFPTHHPLWSAERAAALDHFLRLTYGRSGALAAIALPWNVSVVAQNDVPASFDGVLGPALLVLAPVAAWAIVAKWRAIEPSWRVASGLVGAGLLTWASQSQQVRFLLPILPAAALLAVVALARTAMPPLVRRATLAILGATLAVNVAVTAADVVRADPFRVALGLESRDAYLTRSLAYYELYPILERDMPVGGRVWLVNARADTYSLDVPAFTDTFDEDWTLGDLVNASANPTDVDAAIRARGVTHLLVREDILLSPQYTPFRDEAAVARWLGFVRERTTTLHRVAPYALYALRTEGTTTPR
jgi:hypothetical protein